MLAEQQALWARYLLTGEGEDLGITAPLRQRAAIYRANVLGALARTLALAHPATRRAMGTAAFEAVARAFVGASPPPRPQLNAYGEGFAAQVAASGAQPWIGELAVFEWELHRAYFAEDECPLDPARLRGMAAGDMGRLRLYPQRALRVVASPAPIVSLHAHFCRDAAMPECKPQRGEVALVWRRGLVVQFRTCAPGEAALLRALGARQPLLAAARQAVELDDAFDLRGVLARHLAEGLYRDAECEETRS